MDNMQTLNDIGIVIAMLTLYTSAITFFVAGTAAFCKYLKKD